MESPSLEERLAVTLVPRPGWQGGVGHRWVSMIPRCFPAPVTVWFLQPPLQLGTGGRVGGGALAGAGPAPAAAVVPGQAGCRNWVIPASFPALRAGADPPPHCT